MQNYLSKRYQRDHGTAMSASAALSRSFADCINLSIGDPDFITDGRIIDRACADAKAGHTRYADPQGDPELRQEIRKFYLEEYGMTVADDEVFVCTSGCLGMYLALEAILDDGDEVILPAPYFTPYVQQVELARGIPVELPTYEEEHFQIDMARLESCITAKTAIIAPMQNPARIMGRLTIEFPSIPRLKYTASASR